MTAYVVLGLVGVRPQAGYQLAQFASRSVAHMWPIAKSQVYSELTRLEALGLVSGSDVTQDRLPDKREYALTDAGRDALRAWIEDDAVEERFRSSLLTKLFFAELVDDEQVERMLDGHAARTAERRDHLQRVCDHLGQFDEAFFPRLTALCGLRQAEASLEWIEEARRLIRER